MKILAATSLTLPDGIAIRCPSIESSEVEEQYLLFRGLG